MTIEDKLKLMLEYRKTTGIEIGKRSVNFDKPEKDSKIDNVVKVVHIDNKPMRSFIPTFESSDSSYADNDDDEMFTPLSFSHKVQNEEKYKVALYERIKNMILDIDCNNGYDNALGQFDSVLMDLSNYNSGSLTTSQILVLISTMIVKLEELSKIDYPETSLQEVIIKIEKDSNKMVCSGCIDKYFFSSFFKYYVSIETKNFAKMKDKYKNEVRDLAAHISKKGEMLQILLKWLIT